MNIEAELVETIGAAGKKLHTARSRNDQVATDMRLWINEAGAELVSALVALRSALIEQARQQQDTILPGYTHLQRAQPVRLSHHLLAHEAHLARDTERIIDAVKRQNLSPLGSGAPAGTPHPIDRQQVADALGLTASRSTASTRSVHAITCSSCSPPAPSLRSGSAASPRSWCCGRARSLRSVRSRMRTAPAPR